ncbi:hypothetical protein K432DRAFT_397348 [Lepidopterella palustris CBS 459.81]|uniref:Uncharacterized protein n=1 Tax=Lepidopterella palustris CBS 459.81 TaxID=1314670 RepID=A0A8E2JAZ5_9PEZI|nr:hypothetical protein K432DRAFT_397348 [Lepidopterella palustris CBS 459.81]
MATIVEGLMTPEPEDERVKASTQETPSTVSPNVQTAENPQPSAASDQPAANSSAVPPNVKPAGNPQPSASNDQPAANSSAVPPTEPEPPNVQSAQNSTTAPITEAPVETQAEGGDECPKISDEQRAIIAKILSTDDQETNEILGLPPGEHTIRVKREAFLRRGYFILPERYMGSAEDDERGIDAVNKLVNAAKVEGIDQETLDLIECYAGGTLEDLLEGYEDDTLPDWVMEEYKKAKPFIEELARNPDNNLAEISILQINSRLQELGSEQMDENDYKIYYETILPHIREGRRYLDRLKSNPQDQEAKDKIKIIQNLLNLQSTERYYPWEFDENLKVPKRQRNFRVPNTGQQAPQGRSEERPQATRDPNVGRQQTSQGRGEERPQASRDPNAGRRQASQGRSKEASRGRPASLPGFHSHSIKPGHVLYKNADRGICGIFECGRNQYGTTHQFMVEKYSKNDRRVYELIAASAFGKGAASEYRAKRGADVYTKGTLEDLKDKNIQDMEIGWIGYVPPKGSWACPRTVVAVDFDRNRETVKAYPKSVLWTRFGKREINRQIEAYSRLAGLKKSLVEPKKVIQYVDLDDEDDESCISLEDGDTDEENDYYEEEGGPAGETLSRAEEIQRLLVEVSRLQKEEDKAKRRATPRPRQEQERPRERSRTTYRRRR